MHSTLTLRTTPAEWDKVRAAFAASLMVDTPLASLAENLDGPSWPIKDTRENAAAYIDFDYKEAIAALALRGQPPERLDHLLEILRDTLAFDNPFGEMVAQSETAAERDNPVLVNLAKLGIPASFPLSLTALATDTIDFCRLEGVTTLGEFALLAQRFSRTVVVSGDFRALLNALSHVDEPTLARYLPFRPGVPGLHLIEAVAHLVRALPEPERRQLLAAPASAMATSVGARVTELLPFFPDDRTALMEQIARGVAVTRLVMVLNDVAFEPVVAAALAPHLPPPPTTPKRNWFARLFHA
jgi:hypothetical protein